MVQQGNKLITIFIFVFSSLSFVSSANAYKYLLKNKQGVYNYKEYDGKKYKEPEQVKEIKYFGPLEKNTKVNRTILAAAKKFRVDPLLIKAVIKAESNFKHNAVSHAGAEGIMQIMPSTAVRLGVLNSFNYKESIFGGTRYLRHLLNLFMGNMQLSVAAYNAGENAVLKYGTIPPFKETQLYVKKVISFYNAYLFEKFKKRARRKKLLKKPRNNGSIRLASKRLKRKIKTKSLRIKKNGRRQKRRQKTVKKNTTP